MSIAKPTLWAYLDRKPGSAYRQLFVKGRNIAARTLYSAFIDEDDPRTPEQIAVDFELPLEAVREAIGYCQSNPPEFQQDWEMEEATIQSRTREEALEMTPAPAPPLSGAEPGTLRPRP